MADAPNNRLKGDWLVWVLAGVVRERELCVVRVECVVCIVCVGGVVEVQCVSVFGQGGQLRQCVGVE
jgi:hypothetical protein